MPAPLRGEIWVVDFDPTRGHEQAGRRPALVVSDDRFNRGRARLVFVVPMTTRERNVPTHLAVTPPEGGVRTLSFLNCEDLRSVSLKRLRDGPWGVVSSVTLGAVEDRIRILLRL